MNSKAAAVLVQDGGSNLFMKKQSQKKRLRIIFAKEERLKYQNLEIKALCTIIQNV